ncbi:AraC family transcriptional regulator [Streptomyces sp. ISL-22]|uniref:helix-turn-helix domain-containing protein n=1 Tax=unclassified Streptomyces TaxID=2593676 RepID=UPI001BEA1582|nr:MULTISPECIES: helix-turn-helix domain-containing protein [unclassified Streptomyces]MBT2416313.1 AraC family transcriptional regulator [Streptomyces sp. ISL-24]MBT2434258.1 AraC family transcriptional regulator [Streptomyces sp. ISL-22]
MTSAVRVRSGQGPSGSWETALALPHPRLRPGVISYRGMRLALDRPRRRLEAPIGAATLLLGFDQPVRISRAGRPTDTLVSVYCGPTTTPAVGEHSGRLAGIEVLLMPWAAFTLFGTPQHELANRTVDPDDLPHSLHTRIGELAAALAALPTWGDRFGLLDDVFARWSDAGTPCSARVVRAWAELVRTGGAMPVRRLADEVGWSVRHLENRFREQIGLGPKAAARVLRLQRARRLLAAGRGQAETAAACGFYDQAHLSGEFKAMTGCTPREFTAARRAPVGTPASDRLAGEATSLVLASDRSALFSKTRELG